VAEELPEIPHFMDHRSNGRCRAWWMAHEACPGKKQPYEWAVENVHKFLDRAAKLDTTEGMLPACNAAGITSKPVRMTHNRLATKPVAEPDTKPIRKRTRVAC